ncbi:unnamed protein product, partial [Clonostachys rosea f. rosea IK726]
ESDADDGGTSDRLDAIEHLLREHAEELQALRLQPPPPAAPSQSPAVSLHDPTAVHVQQPPQRFCSTATDSSSPFSIWGFDQNGSRVDSSVRNDDVGPPITIPFGHQTSTSNVLVLPQCRALVGDYPGEFFFRVESSRFRAAEARSLISPSHENSQQQDQLERAICDQYLDSYLARVYPFHPFLHRDEVVKIYGEVMGRQVGFDQESALVLAIVALGAVALEPVDSQAEDRPWEVYFRRALRILLASWTFNFSGDVTIPQALVLCAVYFTYTAEPLMAWRLIHMASTSIQQLLSRYKNLLSSEPLVQTLTRLSWVCFNMESSDILAEFHQPRSGIELLVDSMPFPNYGENASPENLYALAEISVRTLLNRIHHSLFFTDSLAIFTGRSKEATSSSSHLPVLNPDTSHMRVCDELSRQLEAWYDGLPEEVKPELTGATRGNRQACLLRLRYWSSKQNIYRAFLIYVTSRAWEHGEVVPQAVLDMCGTCLHACRMYLMTARHLIYERTPYSYSCAMACLTSSLLLSIAARSRPLQHLAEDIGTIHQVTIAHLKPWAQPHTSIRSAYEIACLVATKQHFNG